jgi:death-on-curing protein
MTGENGSSILYLDREDYEALHAKLAAWADDKGEEPIPPFKLSKEADLESLINAPRGNFFGYVTYPSLEEKAAIIFYSINKNQIFLNGNKRMSTLALNVFLQINGKKLDLQADELTLKALELSKTASLDFPKIKEDLVKWVRDHVCDL